MTLFPYLYVLKRAYELTRKYIWLWACGVFIIGTSAFNLSLPLLRGRFGKKLQLDEAATRATAWIEQHSQLLPALAALVLVVLLFLLLLSAWARSAVITAAGKATSAPPQEPSPGATLKKAGGYFWRVFGLQCAVTAGLLILLGLFSAPVFFLYSHGALIQAGLLALLGTVILLPASLVFGFLHLYGPIFIVLYDKLISEAMSLSFQLIFQKLKEGVLLAAFLIGLELMLIVFICFTLLLFSLPIYLLVFLIAPANLNAAALIIISAAFLASAIYVIVLKAGFAVFANIAWVLAVQEMVQTRKLEKQETALEPEPEVMGT